MQRQSPPPTSILMPSQSLSNSCLPKAAFRLVFLVEYYIMAWNIALIDLSQLSWLCPIPASCPPLACSLDGTERRGKRKP